MYRPFAFVTSFVIFSCNECQQHQRLLLLQLNGNGRAMLDTRNPWILSNDVISHVGDIIY